MADKMTTLYLVMDKTGSMGSFITSLGKTLPQVFDIAQIIFGGELVVKLLAYGDYCDAEIICKEFSGTPEKIIEFAKKLRPSGGGDIPEACKTAMNEILDDIVKCGQHAFVLHYSDAPPHHYTTGGDNRQIEMKMLADRSPGSSWDEICRMFNDFNVPVYTFLPQANNKFETTSFYCLLGNVIILNDTHHTHVTRATICLLNMLMGNKVEDRFTTGFLCNTFGTINWYAIIDDENAGGYLPATQSLDDNIEYLQWKFGGGEKPKNLDQFQTNQILSKQFNFECVPFLKRDMNLLPKLFKEDTRFVDLVLDSLKRIFVPENAFALCYNPIIGTLWRFCCRLRGDDRLDPLRNALSGCVTSVAGEDQKLLQEWIEDSYDMTEQIEERLAEVGAEHMFPAIMLDPSSIVSVDMPDKKELRSISNSPTKEALAKAMKVLTHIKIIDKMPENVDPDTMTLIPLSMNARSLFELLPHLVCPGTLFTMKPAAIMAILAYLSGGILKDHAEAFLNAWKGKWIPKKEDAESFPEAYGEDFVCLLHKVKWALTDEERELYDRLYIIARMRRARQKEYNVEIGYTPSKNIIPDYKTKCKSCNTMRSNTLMLANGTCGLCLSYNDDVPKEIADDKHSAMVQCRTKGCNTIYAVVWLDGLNVEPKCHYCRFLATAPPTIECEQCHNKFLSPGGSVGFTKCALCITPNSNSWKQTESVTLENLVKQNPDMCMPLFGFTAEQMEIIYHPSSGSLFKLFTKYPQLFIKNESSNKPEYEVNMVHKYKFILNAVDLYTKINNDVLTGELTAECVMCFEDLPVNSVRSACGKCNNRVCANCLSTWYKQAEPGKIVLLTHIECPFCKRRPLCKTLKRYNRRLCALANATDTVNLDPSMYHAWCISCYKVKPMMAIECGGTGLPTVNNFRCDSCMLIINQSGDPESKACPNPACGIATIKSGGCNHLQCTQCNIHWCWNCAQEFDADVIYDHMYGYGENDGCNPDYEPDDDGYGSDGSDGYYSDY